MARFKSNQRRTLCLDFDATLSEYSGWTGPVNFGPPVKNSRAAMHLLKKEFILVCLTARSDTDAVHAWLRGHGYPDMRVTNRKVPAHAYIDDRGLTFIEWTDDFLSRIKTFAPYWKTSDAGLVVPDEE